MPVFTFTITAPATQSAQVVIEANSLDEAHNIALSPEFYEDPEKAQFTFDDGNIVSEVYLPDPSDFTIEGAEMVLELFWQNLDISEQALTGLNFTGEMVGNRLVLQNCDTDEYAVIMQHQGGCGVSLVGKDYLAAIHSVAPIPDFTSSDIQECFDYALTEIGFPIPGALSVSR